mgnify:CR=1 FL=1
MGDRRQARELALKALFFLDMDQERTREPGPGEVQNLEGFCDTHAEDLTEGVEPFFKILVNGVTDRIEEIDKVLNQCSKNWKISRMPTVDRNIMRIAAYELTACDDIPASVTINEAVEIGKKYGTRDSGPFINGVLDKVKSKGTGQ